MRVLTKSGDLAPEFRNPDVLRDVEEYCRESRATGSPNVIAYDNDTVLRIVPLNDVMAGCVAIFVDNFSKRGSVFEAAKRFGLTKRESEVLQLVLSARTNNDIADVLGLAESTVSDHLKSIMRKTNVSKRVELVSKVFNADHDSVDEQQFRYHQRRS